MRASACNLNHLKKPDSVSHISECNRYTSIMYYAAVMAKTRCLKGLFGQLVNTYGDLKPPDLKD